MKKFLHQFVASVRRESKKRGKPICMTARGRKRVFHAYDWGCDTFIFEEDALDDAGGHQPILLARKADLLRGASGYVMTVSTGNHAVAAVPLLTGEFWNLGRVAKKRQSQLLMERVICANLVDGKVEVSQRDVPTGVLVEADEWLQGLGFPLDTLVMAERNPATLDHYRRLGQEWRVKPLAWTQREMRLEIARGGGKHIGSSLRYFHSVKGVHFLSYAEFHSLLGADYETCVRALHELVSVGDGRHVPYVRMDKFGGHHEIDLFGLRRGEAQEKGGWVTALEVLMEDITIGKISQEDFRVRLEGLDAMFKDLLERPELADETSSDFIETMYTHLTGAVYEGEQDSVSLSFDGRRTALPGATYFGGRLAFHPGADERTRVLLPNLDQMVSQNEAIEYVNVYELRTHENVRLGHGMMREIEFKTNRRPLCTSMIEKRLKLPMPGYGSYLLARVHAFKALGVNFGEYRLLEQTEHEAGGEVNHFLRDRYPGDSLDDIPARQYRRVDESGEDPDVVLAMAGLLGDAAAQNLAVKKFIPETKGCRFGEGKEIFEFAYGLGSRREMPVRVGMCSVRGVLGWLDVSKTEKNLERMFDFYLTSYARVLARFGGRHREAVAFADLADRFFDGFEMKTREMHWLYSVRREQFDAFDPKVRPYFKFTLKWDFALWALDCQEQRLDALREVFKKKAVACWEGAQ